MLIQAFYQKKINITNLTSKFLKELFTKFFNYFSHSFILNYLNHPLYYLIICYNVYIFNIFYLLKKKFYSFK